MRALGKETYNRVINYHELDTSDTHEEKYLRQTLKPSAGFRKVHLRCYATCDYLKPGDGWAECLRPPEENKKQVSFDLGDVIHYSYVCDRYKSNRL